MFFLKKEYGSYLMKNMIYLLLAILFETSATTLLKVSEGFYCNLTHHCINLIIRSFIFLSQYLLKDSPNRYCLCHLVSIRDSPCDTCRYFCIQTDTWLASYYWTCTYHHRCWSAKFILKYEYSLNFKYGHFLIFLFFHYIFNIFFSFNWF